MTRRKRTQAEIEEEMNSARERLRKVLTYNSTVYTITRYIQRNGIGRVVAPLAIIDGKIQNLHSAVSDALNWKWDDRGGVWTNSEFNLVMELSYALHGHTSKGRNPRYLHASEKCFQAGYTLIHQQL